ncbi:MAG: leucine-rich repeat domain-containing protein [Ruminococcaceae bacterium]|nr:leucine-rich repeat domain-containing protein [Oscillospiraceae bacterium]
MQAKMKKTSTVKRLFAMLSLLLCGVMLFLPFSVFAAEEHPREGKLSDTVSWSFSEDGILSFVGTGAIDSREGWAHWIPDICEIHIGEGITHIGEEAFAGGDMYLWPDDSTNLRKIIFPTTLETVGDGAFNYGWGLPKGVEVHVPSLLDWCEIEFESPTGWWDTPCSYLSSPVVGALYVDGVRLEGVVEFPGELTKVNNCTFMRVSGITEVILHDGITEIGDGAFNRSSVAKVNFPKNLKKIGRCAFAHSGLTAADLPEGLEYLGWYAFEGSKKLQRVTLPSTLKFCGGGAFDSCEKISEVHISDLDAYCRITFGESISDGGGFGFEAASPVYYTGRLLLNGDPVTEVVFPEDVTYISPAMFQNCKDLTRVKFLGEVKYIGKYAFAGCENLREWEGDLYECRIEEFAFSGCKSLTSIPNPKYCYLGRGAFSGCESLTKVYFDADDAESRVFYNCPSLELYVSGLLDMKKVEHSWLDGVSKVYVSTYVTPGEGFLAVYTPTETVGNYVLYVNCPHEWEKEEDPENPCYRLSRCTKCGAEKENGVKHTSGEWETVKEPTETEEGEKRQSCTLCGEVLKTEAIPVLEKTEESSEAESSEEVSEEASEAVSEEESEETSEEESSVPSKDPVSGESEESVPGEEPTQGVPLWTVFLVGALCAGTAAGITWLICKKK